MAPSDTRTIWDIICSCFSTLFACAWIAVHPNIPEDSMEILRRRIMIMTYVLLAPEMVIIWAARQHRDANLLAEKFQIEGHPSWSKTHASVLIMEGFTLYEKGRPIRVIEWKGLEALARAGRVDWPNITERKIKDRSKGDYLSKGIGGHNSSIFHDRSSFIYGGTSTFGVLFLCISWRAMEGPTGQVKSNNVAEDDFFPEDRCLLPLDVTLEREEAVKGDQVKTDNLFISLPPDSPLPLKF